MRRALARLAYYPSLAWNHLLYRLVPGRRYWDRIDAHVVMGAMPLNRHVPDLAAIGVRAVVNLCEEYPGPLDAYRAAGIDQLHLPTIDFTPPSLADVRRGVRYIAEHAAQGHMVYVHCKAGRGRSATLVLCWLIEHLGISPEEAQLLLKSKRRHVVDNLHRRKVVQQFSSGIGT
jgi:atypical dual specificity phosphatase